MRNVNTDLSSENKTSDFEILKAKKFSDIMRSEEHLSSGQKQSGDQSLYNSERIYKVTHGFKILFCP